MRRSLLAVPLAVAVVAACWRLCPWPFAILGPSAAVAAALLARRGGRTGLLLAYLAAALLACGGFEAWLWYRESSGPATRWEGTYDSIFQPDDLLGYAATRSARVRSAEFRGERKLYDVVYTTDAAGLRIAPPHRPDPRGCVLFLGDSVTFGHGLRDEETLPYRVGVRSGGAWEVYNFSFLGWGPHHLLAALEAGRLDTAVPCAPQLAVYSALFHHAERVAGLALWDPRGPRFVASGDGVRLAGHFDDPETRPRLALLERSLLYQTLFGNRRAVAARDLDLLARIVGQMKASFSARGARFLVLLWDDPRDAARHAGLQSLFNSHGMEVVPVSSVLPGYASSPESFDLPHDDTRHPSAAANDQIAAYLVERQLPAPR